MISANLRVPILVSFVTLGVASPGRCDEAAKRPTPVPAASVSYFKDVRAVFQAHCQGCHQPSKAGGGYCMTAVDQLRKGGKSGLPAVVAGKPEESHLIEQITPSGGKAAMPRDKPPLIGGGDRTDPPGAADRAQGAVDDTPQNATTLYDHEHPPVYTRAAVIPALAFAPDGRILAIAGFHEVVLWKPDGSAQVARLIGLSERITSLAFSPDGRRLAATGGRPGQMGEVQVWDVAGRSLILSAPLTFDTVLQPRAGRRTAPRSHLAARTTPSGRSTPRPVIRCCLWACTPIGRSTQSSRPMAPT